MEENKTFKYCAYVGVFVFICAIAWYLLSEPAIHDQRDRARDVEQSLDRAGAEQRNAESNIERIERGLDSGIERIDGIAERVDDAAERIDAVQERRGECAEILGDSESRISESKRIIQAVRERARQDGK